MNIGQLIAEASRELGMRHRVYGRSVEEGRMHPMVAKTQLEAQQQIIEALEYIQQLEPNYEAGQSRGLPGI